MQNLDSDANGWPIHQSLSKFPGLPRNNSQPVISQSRPSREYAQVLAPYGPPSDFPHVLVLAANPIRHAPVNASLGGSVFRRSPRLNASIIANQKDRANILPFSGFSLSGIIHPHLSKSTYGICSARCLVPLNALYRAPDSIFIMWRSASPQDVKPAVFSEF